MKVGLLAILFVTAGCSAPAPKPPPGKTKATPPPVRSITATSPEITVESKDGERSYVVRAKRSEIKVNEDGPEYGTLELVIGEIKEEGKVVSTFEAGSGVVDRDAETLILDGTVKITGALTEKENPGQKKPTTIVLTAKKVRFDQTKDRFEAEGDVTVTSDTMVMGPMPRLWASKDLKRIGTPSKYK